MSTDTPNGLSGEEYRKIFESAPDAMVVVDQKGTILFVNAQTEKMFGYPREQMLGHDLEMLIPERFRSGHAAHMTRYVSQPGARPMGSGLELFGRRADGSELSIEVSLSPVGSEAGFRVSAAIRDITERKRLESAQKILAERLSSAVETIQDAFALFDKDDRLVLCNSVYRRLLGDAITGPLVGRPFHELLDAWTSSIEFVDEAERERFRQERIAHRHDQTASFDVRLRDGRHLRVMDRQTAEGGSVKTIWDLTDDVQRAEELRVARTAAEAGSAAKSEFLSSMSHELRTPLNAILGFAQLLQRDKKEPLSTRHKDRVDQILKGGEHLLRLIDDILDLSKIEAGGISISTEPVSVDDVLEEVRRTLDPIATRQSVTLEMKPLPQNLPMISADRTRFAQILMNFGSNAIKYNRANGNVAFTVDVPRPERVRITVSDSGHGIPSDKQDKLFQPFQRAGQETGPIEGTGIGLVITKRLAQLMHGDVGFKSAPGHGSDFWVELPAHEDSASSLRTQAAAPRATETLSSAARRRVLYVEDNPANVTFMKDLLDNFENLELLTSPTAEMGIEIARSNKPDVVIMDINLPGMSGVEALGVLRSLDETRAIPVIALTAAASERDKQRGLQAGFFRYLTKPVKVDELIAALESLLVPAT